MNTRKDNNKLSVEKELTNNKFINILDIDRNDLYHYTSSNAFINIINNGTLWMSNSDFLNDRYEIYYFHKLYEKAIQNNSENYEEAFLKFSSLNKTEYEFFILSLSDNPDSLALWSNYSNNDGYNIGFHVKNFTDNLKRQMLEGYPTPVLGKVIYNKNTQNEIIKEEINRLHRFWKQGISKQEEESVKSIFSLRMTVYSLFFKDPSFQQEEEYRLVLIYHKSNLENIVHFRDSNGSIIPYVSVSPVDDASMRLPIKSISIGPKNNVDCAEKGLKRFLESRKYSESTVIKSSIPYRF